ncbi:hypothetical protein V6x_53920 [Gimesia chilikensis]|uniref:Uncharacterized protein n=1 Tax=Gimesia chilikensis TaxID=2605989 RepID=A0A517WK71_9PLAN|nr:hypothetical protein [Gimesia chilikensis]QDU05652.1 hypothetical protein V6x_53920 [Gimesia chilikensis]
MELKDTDLFAIYSGGPRIKPSWQEEDIQQFRQQLLAARLRYAVCHPDAASIMTPRPFTSPEAARQAMADASDRLGVVLVAPAV